MKLQDFTTKKIKEDMKFWGKRVLWLLGVTAVCLPIAFGVAGLAAFAGQQFITATLFLAGASCGLAGLGNLLPSYLDSARDYRKHYKYLEANKDQLKYTDNQFEIIEDKKKSKEVNALSSDLKQELNPKATKTLTVSKTVTKSTDKELETEIDPEKTK